MAMEQAGALSYHYDKIAKRGMLFVRNDSMREHSPKGGSMIRKLACSFMITLCLVLLIASSSVC